MYVLEYIRSVHVFKGQKHTKHLFQTTKGPVKILAWATLNQRPDSASKKSLLLSSDLY